jgi:hypothetical protein
MAGSAHSGAVRGRAQPGDDDEDRGAREQRLGRRPEQLAGDDVGQPDGVFRMASQVFCTGIRENDEYSASKVAAFIVEAHTVPAARRRRRAGRRSTAASRPGRSRAEHVDQRVGQVAEDGWQREFPPDEKLRCQTGNQPVAEKGEGRMGSFRLGMADSTVPAVKLAPSAAVRPRSGPEENAMSHPLAARAV